jgi:tetratricopeptide (TPR) repeat protein
MRECSERWSAIALVLCALIARDAVAATGEPVKEIQVDPAPCVAAIAANDDDNIVALCRELIDNEKTQPRDRLKALIARGGVYVRKEQTDSAIADYDAALRIDPTQADLFNARGELWRNKGDRPRAIRDFGAAIKLDPQHETARANYKALALEIERMGAAMAIKGQLKPPLK